VQRTLVSIANPLDPATRAANPPADRDFQLWQAMDCQRSPYSEPPGSGKLSHPGRPS
jgi:hypothetical protein